MKKSKKIAIMASSLIFISGMTCGVAVMGGITALGNSVTVSADSSICNGLKYTNYGNGNIITGYTEQADLVNLVIPDEIDGTPVIGISNEAFYECTSMETLVIGKNVTYIGKNAFSGRYRAGYAKYINLSEITIPDNLISIGSDGIEGFSYVTIQKINVPASCSFIHERFISDENITEINVQQGNKKYSSDKGILYSADKSTLIKAPAGTAVSSYNIDRNTASISDHAFENCGNLTEIVMGDKVKTVGNYAFNGCKKLSDIVLGENIISIGDYAFNDCYHILNVDFGKSLTSIGDYAFTYCYNLTKIIMGDKVKTVGNYAFCGCSGVSEIVLGKNLTSIGDHAFEGAYQSTDDDLRAEITLPDHLEVLGQNAFTYITRLNVPASVTFISDIFYYNLALKEFSVDENNKTFSSDKGILYSADKSTLIRCPKNTSLTSYTVNENTRTISDHAFEYSLIPKIDIGNSVTSIGNYAFYNCMSRSEVIMGKNVQSVGNYAFAAKQPLSVNTSLSGYDLTLSDNLQTIGENAFENAHIFKLNIPDSVTYISDILYNISALKEISVDQGNKIYSSEKGILFSADKSTLIRCPKNTSLSTYSVGGKTTTIAPYAFSQCCNLTQIVTGFFVETIGDHAFYRSNNLSILYLSNTVKSIGDYALAGMSEDYVDEYMNFSILSVPDNIESLGEHSLDYVNVRKLKINNNAKYIPEIFYNLLALKEISVTGGNENFCSDKGILYTGDKSTLIKCPVSSPLLNYIIPDGTTSINNSAFYKTKIETIFIPESVKSIGDDTFNASKLTTIRGITGSYAQTYAEEHKFTFVPSEPDLVTTTPTVTTKPPVVTTTPPANTSTKAPVSTTAPKITSVPVVTSAVNPKMNYDVNGDGKINIMDIMYLKKYILTSK